VVENAAIRPDIYLKYWPAQQANVLVPTIRRILLQRLGDRRAAGTLLKIRFSKYLFSLVFQAESGPNCVV
jgi:hypothetical protein